MQTTALSDHPPASTDSTASVTFKFHVSTHACHTDGPGNWSGKAVEILRPMDGATATMQGITLPEVMYRVNRSTHTSVEFQQRLKGKNALFEGGDSDF